MARNAFQLARYVIRTLRAAGHEALLAGGCVRDMLLGVRPKDYDVATSAHPKQAAALFTRTRMVGAAFGVVIVLEGRHKIEVATFRTDHGYSDGRRPDAVTFTTARQDARRRDFTINGMFYDPTAERVIDYVEGRRDLKRRRIRAIGDANRRFSEDYLRMLRAVRFSARLRFPLEKRTAAAIRRHAGRITKIAAERVREELSGILAHPSREEGIALAHRLGLLEHILPECLPALRENRKILARLPRHASTALCLATLLSPSPTDAQIYPPENVAAKRAAAACHRLRSPNAQTRRVKWLVANRGVACRQDRLDDAGFRRLAANEGFEELCTLSRAAAKTVGVPSPARYRAMKRRVAQWPTDSLLPPPLLNGQSLKTMGYGPGPRFGSVLKAVYDAQLNGQLRTRSQASRLAAEMMERKV